MFESLSDKINDPQFMLAVLTAIATMAAVITVAMPLLQSDTLAQRMKTGRQRARTHPRART